MGTAELTAPRPCAGAQGAPRCPPGEPGLCRDRRDFPRSIRGFGGQGGLFAHLLPCGYDPHLACPEGGGLRRGRGGLRGSLPPPKRDRRRPCLLGGRVCACPGGWGGSVTGPTPAPRPRTAATGPCPAPPAAQPGAGSLRAATSRASAPREDGSGTEVGTRSPPASGRAWA